MKRMVIAGALLSGLTLSACGSSSSSSLPSAPSYATIQANLTAITCGSEQQNQTPSYVWKVQNSARGPETICDLQDPSVVTDPPSTTVTASCAYDISKVAIGYSFSCTILNPGSTEAQYVVQFQTPMHGKWWYVASSTAGPGTPAELRSVSYWETRY
jgi:hypothetical protein